MLQITTALKIYLVAMRKLKERVLESCSHVSIVTHILVCVFSTGSWIANNGLSVEMPVIIPHLPEGWALPSYLYIITQISNVGPLIYVIGSKHFPSVFRQERYICVLIFLGILGTSLLAFFWKETTYIAGTPHSTAFMVLAFVVSMVDTTSVVTFLPFMSVLPEFYISTYFVGEGFSGVWPSLVALAQGVECREYNNSLYGSNVMILKSAPAKIHGTEPNFSPRVFFLFLCAMMVASGLAFAALNFLPLVKRQYVDRSGYIELNEKTRDMSEKSSRTTHDISMAKSKEKINSGPTNNRERDGSETEKHYLKENSHKQNNYDSEINDEQGHDKNKCGQIESRESTVIGSRLTLEVIVFLLIILGASSALLNSVIPSILPYACIPYSYNTYLLTLTLSNIIRSVMALAFPLMRTRSMSTFKFLNVVFLFLCVYIITVAKKSPAVPLQHTTVGVALIVSTFFVCSRK